MRNAGVVLTHTTIYDRIWGYDFGPSSKNLAVYICVPAAQGRRRRAGQADPHRPRRRVRGPDMRKPVSSLSLRTKIAALFALVATLGTIAVGVLAYASAASRLRSEVDNSLALVASTSDFHVPGGDSDNDNRVPPTIDPRSGVVQQWLLPNGRVLASPAGITLPVTEVDKQVAAGQRHEVSYDTSVDGVAFRVLTVQAHDARGAVMLARSTAEVHRVLETLRWQIALAVLLVALLSGLAGWLLARRLTSRLGRLTAAAEEVAATGRLDVPVPAEGGDETGRLGVAFGTMLAALSASRLSQQRLVQDAGHELRTPLTSLRTNVSVLRRYTALPAAERETILRDLDAESRELTDMVNELVTLAAVGAEDEDVARVALGDLADRAAERAERRYGCAVLVTADESEVVARPAALERAVTNLVDNAAKFGGAVGPVQVRVSSGTLEVIDQGPGIPLSDLPHVFERFYRSDDARSMPGSGLGLSIVADVVAAHGGQVFARCDIDGTHVGFSLAVPERSSHPALTVPSGS